ncbi:elongation factor Ts, mitochondrial [Pseudomyrmex gracilis]|uniref:elongation factor Ts, mitochondrial n=1 Tax=Pseudomyrmex gracilis TaxID=219809 RepID=UPI0009955D75|nr:elongation factor Ts, mitochondrial [Pseudomyrmex gracilis]XP_020291729.1 elongation factor Ts, mitochondrial [Pseudomyrmex gracilis]XP_020291730.1 elongation factor Ts, mitochondrial [Pseudomyrmex gracilis]
MMPAQIFRLIHTNNYLWQATKKSLLSKLRKKTGYTFANCKKALELHENDVDKAEAWLKEQAQQQGWVQAAKLQGRNTTQGLIAVTVDGSHAAVAEINCETDFVARNKKFHNLAETVVTAILNHTKSQEVQTEVQRTIFHTDSLKSLAAPDGKSLADHSALTIGNLGENITLRRALAISVSLPNVTLFGCTHPAPMNPIPVSFGKYGALVAIKCKHSDHMLGTQLCQHIIGMDPQKIGNPREDEPHNNIDEETCMIYQEFLLDPSLSVQQLLDDVEAEIMSFARFEVGEQLDEESMVKNVQTCA